MAESRSGRLLTDVPELLDRVPLAPTRLEILRHINDHLIEQRDLAARIGSVELSQALDEAQQAAHRVMVAESLLAR